MTTKSTPSTATETGERWLLSEFAALVRLLREDFDAVYSPVAALHLTQTADSLLADYDAVANTVNSHAELEREQDALLRSLIPRLCDHCHNDVFPLREWGDGKAFTHWNGYEQLACTASDVHIFLTHAALGETK